MRVADYIAARLSFLGVDTSFLVTGGGAMYLNDAIGADESIRQVTLDVIGFVLTDR